MPMQAHQTLWGASSWTWCCQRSLESSSLLRGWVPCPDLRGCKRLYPAVSCCKWMMAVTLFCRGWSAGWGLDMRKSHCFVQDMLRGSGERTFDPTGKDPTIQLRFLLQCLMRFILACWFYHFLADVFVECCLWLLIILSGNQAWRAGIFLCQIEDH